MKLTITLDEKTNKLSINSNEPIRIDDMMTILFTLQLETMRNFMKSAETNGASKKDLQELKEDLYDKYNAGASNVLYLFAPDEELRPDLTVEAMKEAEDRYMYNQLNRKARREVDKKTHNETKVLRFPKQTKQGE